MADDIRINNDALKRQALKEEPRFLSILIKDRECLMEAVAAGIKPDHFWNNDARFLFQIIHQYYIRHNAILTRTAMESIMDSIDSINKKPIDDEDRANARMYWDKVYSTNIDVQDFNLLMRQISNRYVQYQAHKIMREKIEALSTATNDQDTMVKKIREEFFKIEGIDLDPYTLTMGMDEGMDKVLEYLKEKRENPVDKQVVLTGLKAIDDVYCGLEFGTYTVITGMINGGKTTLMFNIAFNMAKAGYNVVYVSLEKKAVPFFSRLLSLHALVDYNRIRRGGKSDKGLDDFHYARLQEAAKDLQENIKPKLTCIQMAQGTKLSKMLAEVDRVQNRLKAQKDTVHVLIVDYLGAIGNETTTVGRSDLDDALTSQRLIAYGRINNYVTITAAQLKTLSSKEIRNKAKKAGADEGASVEVNTEDIGGSKMIIADADYALGAVLNGDSPPTKMFVYTTKARDAESRKTLCLDFDGKLGRISDQVLEPGQIRGVDDLLYSKEITEEDLKSDDGLFSPKILSIVKQNTDDLFEDAKEAISTAKDILDKQEDKKDELDDFLDVN